MFTGMLHTHTLFVTLFLLLYLVKTVLLLMNKNEVLEKFRKKTLVPEMIISTIFLLTGIYLALNSGQVTIGSWFGIKISLIFLIIPLGVIAFKKSNRILAVLGLLLIVYAYGISETKNPTFKKPEVKKPDDTVKPISTIEEKIAIGNVVYNEKCSLCHGDDGKKMLSGAPDLSITKMIHDEMLNIIANGKNAMLPFNGQLSGQEIDAVAYYVETLKKYADKEKME